MVCFTEGELGNLLSCGIVDLDTQFFHATFAFLKDRLALGLLVVEAGLRRKQFSASRVYGV